MEETVAALSSRTVSCICGGEAAIATLREALDEIVDMAQDPGAESCCIVIVAKRALASTAPEGKR